MGWGQRGEIIFNLEAGVRSAKHQIHTFETFAYPQSTSSYFKSKISPTNHTKLA